MLDQATIDRILDAANIVEVVTDYGVTLRKRGVNYVGLCPFHDERTPSFSVSPAKALCKCFSCGKGGNVVHFVMEYEGIGYFDALRVLARKYGIEVHERELSDDERRAQSERESMFVANAYARDYFVAALTGTEEGASLGMAYFRSRGFRDDTIAKFELGYCLEARDAFAREALSKGYSREVLLKTGLCIEKEGFSTLVDRFRGRVMFPVHTMSGRVVAFGGRILNASAKVAKYQNSPESEIYHKSRELYGIYFAKRAIQQNDSCFLVEGYTDVIQMHQAGIENVVASSGTSLTPGQISLIKRLTGNITVLYDGDSAGIKASLRGVDLLLEEGMNVKVVTLPEGEDPDSFARSRPPQEFRDYVSSNEVDFIRFKASVLLQGTGGDPVRRAEAIAGIVSSIALISDPIKRSVYIKETSGQLEISEEVLTASVNKQRKTAAEALRKQAGRQKAAADTATQHSSEPEVQEGGHFESKTDKLLEIEKLIAQTIVRYATLVVCTWRDEETGRDINARVAEFVAWDLSDDDLQFKSPLHRKILEDALLHINDEGFDSKRYFLSHPDVEVSKFASEAIGERYHLSKYHSKFQTVMMDEDRIDRLVPWLMMDLKNEIIKERIDTLMQMMRSPEVASDVAKCQEVMNSIMQLKEIQKALGKELGERIILPK